MNELFLSIFFGAGLLCQKNNLIYFGELRD